MKSNCDGVPRYILYNTHVCIPHKYDLNTTEVKKNKPLKDFLPL